MGAHDIPLRLETLLILIQVLVFPLLRVKHCLHRIVDNRHRVAVLLIIKSVLFDGFQQLDWILVDGGVICPRFNLMLHAAMTMIP